MPNTARISRTRQTPKRGPRNTRLLELRINAGYSREDLAARSGVSRETIRLAEHGFTPASPRIQFQIAQAFDLRPLDIWPLEKQRVAA